MTDREILMQTSKEILEFCCMGIAIFLLIPFALPFYIWKTVKMFVQEITKEL